MGIRCLTAAAVVLACAAVPNVASAQYLSSRSGFNGYAVDGYTYDDGRGGSRNGVSVRPLGIPGSVYRSWDNAPPYYGAFDGQGYYSAPANRGPTWREPFYRNAYRSGYGIRDVVPPADGLHHDRAVARPVSDFYDAYASADPAYGSYDWYRYPRSYRGVRHIAAVGGARQSVIADRDTGQILLPVD